MNRQPYRTTTPSAYRVVIAGLRPIVAGLTRQVWSGGEHLPAEGGFIVAANHVSEIDPFTLAHFLVDHGTPPAFLAKESLFRIPVVGPLLPRLGQVPVHRGTARATESLDAAGRAVTEGHCVVILPEGTLSRDPDLWPMRARPGVGRLALQTRAPVVPVAQWGPQQLLAPYARRPTGLFSRVPMHVRAGAPVPLDDLYDRTDEAAAAREATDRVVRAITRLVADLRGEDPPAVPWDHRLGRRPVPGEEVAE